jgi:hypothetical protein
MEQNSAVKLKSFLQKANMAYRELEFSVAKLVCFSL